MLALLAQAEHADGAAPEVVVELATRARRRPTDRAGHLRGALLVHGDLRPADVRGERRARATIAAALADGQRRGSAFARAGARDARGAGAQRGTPARRRGRRAPRPAVRSRRSWRRSTPATWRSRSSTRASWRGPPSTCARLGWSTGRAVRRCCAGSRGRGRGCTRRVATSPPFAPRRHAAGGRRRRWPPDARVAWRALLARAPVREGGRADEGRGGARARRRAPRLGTPLGPYRPRSALRCARRRWRARQGSGSRGWRRRSRRSTGGGRLATEQARRARPRRRAAVGRLPRRWPCGAGAGA